MGVRMSRTGREVGALGFTAYAGLHVVDALRGGETVWVSAAGICREPLAERLAGAARRVT